MGKLVVYLTDGTTMDVPLDKERITIGRRADNDVCLQHPAVSSEHAAVVTILADSFLEDQGSTNGTLVNGKSALKHFLRDHDRIEIGRQRMTYVSDDNARVDPLSADIARNHVSGAANRVPDAVPLTPVRAIETGGEVLSSSTGVVSTESWSPEVVGAVVAPAGESLTPAVLAPPHPSVRVLSGASLGRTVAFPKDQLSLGRIGVQVAVVRKVPDGFLLVPIEGEHPPRINGLPVAPDGSPLHPGDTFEVAGVRLELALP